MPSVNDFSSWEPLLKLVRAVNAESLQAGGHVAGRIGRRASSLPLQPRFPPPGRALFVEDIEDQNDAVGRVQNTLADEGLDEISFVAEMWPTGRTMLHLLTFRPAAEAGGGAHPGSLILVENSVPEPWRRLPDPVSIRTPSEAFSRAARLGASH